ncbi:MAG: DUF3098 domain-containing protein [Paludibacteraceae bacterium]|nr:DUF3098 domain-containing protein [Paludibacteraceae bacterium]
MKSNKGYALPKKNLLLLAVGFVIILVGFALMIGGGAEGTEFNPEIFSAQRVTVGPMIALFGFVFEIFAILWVPEEKEGLVVADEDTIDDKEEEGLTIKF